jgi:hypothetical protein
MELCMDAGTSEIVQNRIDRGAEAISNMQRHCLNISIHLTLSEYECCLIWSEDNLAAGIFEATESTL